MKRNIDNLKRLIREVIPKIPKERKCECGSALEDALL